ncbi:unnamed protein product [Cuscuta campestris]|uniref:Transposase (putative) gypsy type domain-containing protein n=1 Tax=Cuscuta campestris TaxID=132261 RepID=A0A484LAS4_9ASTE|nr:unnamed protein product [Cuscuta campestris]
MACRFAFLLSVKNRRWTPSLPFAFSTTVRLQLRCSPDSFFFLSRSVPSLAAMIVSDSDSATPSPNSRQAGQSASDRNPGHTPSPRPSPSAVHGHRRRRLRKQYPSSTPVDEGSRVELDENIMALCHCQITNRGFADATDMVGPSIEVMRPTHTQTALDAPSGFFTVHLASLKKGLRFPLHPLLIEFLNVVDLLPCQLVPNSHRFIAGYLVRCKDIGVNPTLDHFIFTFKLTKGHKDWASCASLSQRAPFLPSHPTPPPDATLLSITRQFCNKGVMNIKEVVTEETLAGLGFEFVQDELRHQPDLLRDIPGGHQPDQLKDIPEEGLDCGPFEDQARISAGSEDDLDNMVLLRLSQATLGMIEVVGRKRGRQAAADEVMKATEAKQKELQEEVARLTRELEEKENRCAALTVEKASQENRCVALEADKASLSLEVKSVSARVVELEGEKSNLIQKLEVERGDRVRHAEGAVESFKSSPDFTVVAMERMEELTAAWLKTEPGAQWMVKEGTKSFNCGLFHAQQVFRNRLAQLPKGFSLPDLGFPSPCRSLAEFDPSPYLDGGSSSASEEEEEEEVEGGQSDMNPGASFAMSKAVWAQLLVPARLPARAQSLDWPSCRPIDPMPFTVSDWTFARLKAALSWPSVKPPPPPPNPYEDFHEAYEALSANRLPDGRIDWDALCPLHSLQSMAWESFQDEHLPLLEHECAYYASFERWTSESHTSSPVRPSEEVVLGEELGSPLPRPACRSLPQKTPRRPEVARAASGSPSSPR